MRKRYRRTETASVQNCTFSIVLAASARRTRARHTAFARSNYTTITVARAPRCYVGRVTSPALQRIRDDEHL